MNPKNKIPKTPFDCLISSTRLDIMKLLLPYIDNSFQYQMALYVKILELQETIKLFSHPSKDIHAFHMNDLHTEEPLDIFSVIQPYLPPENQEMFHNISNMMHMMEIMNQMQAASGSDGDTNSFDMLKSMLTPEQQAQFEAMNQLFEEQILEPEDTFQESR